MSAGLKTKLARTDADRAANLERAEQMVREGIAEQAVALRDAKNRWCCHVGREITITATRANVIAKLIENGTIAFRGVGTTASDAEANAFQQLIAAEASRKAGGS